jgi:uncharacterized protein YbcI
LEGPLGARVVRLARLVSGFLYFRSGLSVFQSCPGTGSPLSATEKPEQAAFLADIGRRLAQLHTKYYGKGPTNARTYMLNDTVICLLEGGFTTVERTLIADGNSEAVHHIRRSFQTTMEKPFKDVVEGASDRRVLAYMSQIHTSPDIAVELFVLEPQEAPVVGEHREAIGAPGAH